MAAKKGSGKEENFERQLLEEISHKLDVLTGVIAIQGKELRSQITTLTKLGLSSAEIGVLIGKNPDYVREVRTRKARKKAKAKK